MAHRRVPAAASVAVILLISLVGAVNAAADDRGFQRSHDRRHRRRDAASSTALPPTVLQAPHSGAAGPPPLGAAGPPPLGAAGPPPFGAAGPPPLGVAGPPPARAASEPHIIVNEPVEHEDGAVPSDVDEADE